MAGFWTECYRTHFEKRYQKPFDIQVYHDHDGFSLKLALHDLVGHGYRLYASMGLADKLAQRDEEEIGEVVLYAEVPDPEVPPLFIHALFFILHHEIPLGSRFAIGIEPMQPRFARRYHKSALYFTLFPEGEELSNLVRNGEEFGRVYQAIFIAAEEQQYLEEVGPAAFEEKWLKQEADRNRIRRPSSV